MRPTPSPPRPHPSCRQTRSSIDGDPSFSIHLSLCSTDFHQLPRSYEEIRLLHAHRHSRRCLLPAYRSRGPMQISQGKDTECTAAPGLNTAPISVGFRALRSLARSPDRPGLSKASLAFGAAACLRLLPHTASRRQGLGVSRRRSLHCMQLPSARGCYQLAPQRTFTSNPVPMPGRPPSTPYRGPFGPSAAETTYYASALTGTDPLLLMETDPASAHEFVISWPDRPIPGRL